MTMWPLLNRNKVEDSRVIIPVQACVEQDNLAVKELAQKASYFSSISMNCLTRSHS
jgi:hypothetical protein